MAKKTIKIEDLRKITNNMLLHSVDEWIDQRQGAMSLLEDILHKTGNYKGFGYLSSRDMLQSNGGTTVGINTNKWPDAVKKKMTYAEQFKGTDKTRVYYY